MRKEIDAGSLKPLLKRVRETRPLVHCITNVVTVNDCANMLLAVGAAPIMACAEEEVAEIAAKADALCVNIGTLNRTELEAMTLAAQAARSAGRPVTLDPVGAGATAFRTESSARLLESKNFTLVRGNLSEIRALAGFAGETRGTDAVAALDSDTLDDAVRVARLLAQKLGTLIGVSGAVDIVTDGERTALLRNGHPIMTSVTGTGCMLSALTAAFLGANRENPFEAALAAFAVMGVCGEMAFASLAPNEGPQAWRVRLLDAVALLDPDVWERQIRIETL